MGEYLQVSPGPRENSAALSPGDSWSQPEVPCGVLGGLQTFLKYHCLLSLKCVTQVGLDSRVPQGSKMLSFCRKEPRIGDLVVLVWGTVPNRIAGNLNRTGF